MQNQNRGIKAAKGAGQPTGMDEALPSSRGVVYNVHGCGACGGCGGCADADFGDSQIARFFNHTGANVPGGPIGAPGFSGY